MPAAGLRVRQSSVPDRFLRETTIRCTSVLLGPVRWPGHWPADLSDRVGSRRSDITASDCSQAALDAFQAVIPEATRHVGTIVTPRPQDLVVLALKPQHLPPVLDELRPVEAQATWPCPLWPARRWTACVRHCGTDRVIRVMPNTPALVGAGAAAFCRAAGATADDAATVTRLLEAVGRCWELPESLLDAVTGTFRIGPSLCFSVHRGPQRRRRPDGSAATGRLGAWPRRPSWGRPSWCWKRASTRPFSRIASRVPGGTTIAGLQALGSGCVPRRRDVRRASGQRTIAAVGELTTAGSTRVRARPTAEIVASD